MGAVVIFTVWPLCPWGNSPLYPLSRRLGGSRRRSRQFGEKISPVSTGSQTTISRSSRPLPVQIYFNLTVMAERELCFRQDV